MAGDGNIYIRGKSIHVEGNSTLVSGSKRVRGKRGIMRGNKQRLLGAGNTAEASNQRRDYLRMATSNHTLTIPLSKGQVAIIDNCDADLADLRWYSLERQPGKFYARRDVRGSGKTASVYIHRIVAERLYERAIQPKEVVDHIDGNSLNNQRNNLRITDQSGNCRNRKLSVRNKLGYKGVFQDGNRFRASVRVNGKVLYLGSFTTPEEAYEAYCKGAKRYYGEFARFE